jgi:hypothetical protein
MNFLEHDPVRLKEGVSPLAPARTRGAIVFVYDANPPVYEVELFDDQSESLGTFTIPGFNLLPLAEK